ncbi:hypothetical protein MKZ38_002078 [Zalerion maritima]|uniref:Extracellular serine-rich protein n=1 Tax=Zalerion maritima TaxID=339359 RepID=A0AAD5WXE2_9PEZI|nr:hypothetical protein MKZ38_002078 [Zalerion maritima]
MKSILATAAAFLAATVNAAHHEVAVGKDGLTYTPEDLVATVGDTITYHFYAKNHSVTQSSFQEPCKPLEGGVFSGFVPVPEAGVESATTFTITVNDTKPIWIYCGQTAGDHCQSGMVSAINAPDKDGARLSDFKALATKASRPTTVPADGLPVGGLRLTKVKVGVGKDLMFEPSDIAGALPGEVVRFGFNPANHSVVQAPFQEPCKFLEDGFSSGFVPTDKTPSGVNFDIVVKDTKPIWFYCAQTGGGNNVHCNKGMVGSINAPTPESITDFQDRAADAGLSTIPDHAPKGGVLSIDGYTIPYVGGNVLDIKNLDPSMLSQVPPPGEKPSPYIIGMAGGAPPASYFWAPTITETAVAALQFLNYVDNILATILVEGHVRLTPGAASATGNSSTTGGSWAGAYPESITAMFGSVAAQTVIHRRTSTDCLQHYSHSSMDTCSYTLVKEDEGVTPFLAQALKVYLLSVGATIDAMAKIADTDAWLIPALATQMGAKTRALALINLMQGHNPSAAPREVQIPMSLVYSYIKDHYILACDSAVEEVAHEWAGNTTPRIEFYDLVKTKTAETGKERTTHLKVKGEGVKYGGDNYLAWMGPWGGVQYSAIEEDGSVEVPYDLYGHVWAVVTKGKGEDTKLKTMEELAYAGPEMVWISQP